MTAPWTVPFETLEMPGRFRSVFERFAHVAAALPDAPAVVDGDLRLGYAELAARIERLAGRLTELVPAGEEPVGILLPHDHRVVEAVFAVLRMDRAFVFLDPAVPAARLADIAEDAGIAACFTTPDLASMVGDLRGDVLAVVDDGRSAAALPQPVRGDADAAFIVFTSGSTGRPKGVVETHAQMLNEAATLRSNVVAAGPGQSCALLFPMAFVGGPVALFGMLLNGATIHILDARTTTPRLLLDRLKAARVTMLGMSPHLLRTATELLEPGEILDSVTLLTTGGEGIMGQDVEAFRKHLNPGTPYMNAMGSSEATTMLAHVVPGTEAVAPGTVPAGTAMPNKEVWIVREDGSRADEGETGRMLAVSHYLSGGYWRNDELNRQHFGVLPDGRRTFLFGDLGRIDADGVLTLVGRADRAVKVRGYLVDLSEIEDAVRANPKVSEVLVVPDVQEGRPTRLVAYVAQRADELPDSVAELRRALRAALPIYMVPGAIVPMTALPRNERGKVDRSALPQPEEAAVADTWFTQHEVLVGEIWADVLGLDAVARDGDFFTLGGDSLSVEEMLAAVEDRFGLRFASTDLLAAPTLLEFARIVERGGATGRPHADVVHLRQGERRLFCFAGAGGLAMQFLPVARHLEGWDVWGIQAHGLEGRGMPDRTVEAQARRSVRDIRAIQAEGPYVLAGHSFGGVVALEVAHQLRAAGEEVEMLVQLDSFLTMPEAVADPFAREVRPVARMLRGSMNQRIARAVRTMMAGIVQIEGQEHFEAFTRRAAKIGMRYRIRQYDGAALLVVARPLDDLPADWSRHFSGRVATVGLVAQHQALLREPHAADLARIIRDAIEVPVLQRR